MFLLSGIASLLGVFAGRLARIADRVDALEERLDSASPAAKATLEQRLSYLRRWSHILDATVVLGALAGAATCAAALTLFFGTLRDHTVKGFLFADFGTALLCTMGALGAFWPSCCWPAAACEIESWETKKGRRRPKRRTTVPKAPCTRRAPRRPFLEVSGALTRNGPTVCGKLESTQRQRTVQIFWTTPSRMVA